MSTYHNYIEGTNPFKLAGPPRWFLTKLAEFDSSLVIMPSQQGFYYRLAQRRRPNLASALINDLLFQESDTQMLATRNLVPVTTILATANWDNPLLFVELANRAPHRNGGAEKVMQHIEESEAAAQAKLDANTAQHLTDVAKAGWKSYQYRSGQRVSLADANRGRR